MYRPAPLSRRTFLHHSATLAATTLIASRLSPLLHAGEPGAEFRSAWDRSLDRIWLGTEYWANPHQDWHVAGGRIECVNAAPDRNVHLLPRQLANRSGTLDLRVRIGRAGGGPLAGKGSAGFRIGILGSLKDYPELHDFRNNLWPAPASGFDAGFTANGVLFLGRPGAPGAVKLDLARDAVDLRLILAPKDGAYEATLTALDPAAGRQLAQTSLAGLSGDALVGNLALVNNFSAGGAVNAKGKAKAKGKAAVGGAGTELGRFWFADWRVNGQTFQPHVFAPGLSTIKVGEPETSRMKTLAGLEAAVGNPASPGITL